MQPNCSSIPRTLSNHAIDEPNEEVRSYMLLYDTLSPVARDLHLLSPPFHPFPLVPMLCAADEDNIIPIMCGALTQRSHLRCDYPVVGIVYPARGSIGRILLGWSDDSSEVCNSEPLRGRSVLTP